MKRLQKAAVIAELTDEMRKRGSWCGETHLQKASYFLKELFGVELDYEFILYRHGPFSFDLREELLSLRADGLLVSERQRYPYGPRLAPTESGEEMKKTYPRTLKRHRAAIEFVAARLGDKDVNGLERVATALFVTRGNPSAPSQKRAALVHDLKPHVSIDRAEEAVEEVDEMLREAEETQAA